jgi:glutaredoxin 3
MTEIMLYTTEPCGYCRRMKALLEARGLDYVEINLSKDPAGRAQLAQRTGMMTFPQLIVGEEVIGGFDEAVAAERSGRLAQLLAA